MIGTSLALVKEYSSEIEKLYRTERNLEEYIDLLRKEKRTLHDFFTAVLSSSWRSGKAKEKFQRSVERYMDKFSYRIQMLEETQVEVIKTRKEVNILHKKAIIQSSAEIAKGVM
ncbi:hypothetical protein [Bacillus massilinigeriensis]|uniref:hypothetical protein n=1 Tax=Bacillus mediterraneensis TaxID=1805474 RepID=UPI0008F89083|nr:hypothetical protein [Bacillus mediterraneensis]